MCIRDRHTCTYAEHLNSSNVEWRHSTRTRYKFRNFISCSEHRQHSPTQYNLRGLMILCLTLLLTCLHIAGKRPMLVKRLNLGLDFSGIRWKSMTGWRNQQTAGQPADQPDTQTIHPSNQPTNQPTNISEAFKARAYKGSRVITKLKTMSVSVSPGWP